MESGTTFRCAIKWINMSAFTNLIANMVSGFIPSVISMFRGLDNKGWTPDNGAQHVAEDLASLQDQNLISNYMRKTTGSSLTDAEMQANEWNRQQTIDAWARQMEADNTKYQRQVADLQAAGLNPMLAAGSGAHVPQASVASGVSPSASVFNLDSIFNLLQLKGINKEREANIKVAQASASERQAAAASHLADADLKRSQAAGQDFLNEVNQITKDVFVQQREADLRLTIRQSRVLNKQIDEIASRINYQIEQTRSEVKKQALYGSQVVLNEAQAYQIYSMIEYDKRLKSAQTDSARAAAGFAAVQTAYQQNLLDSDYIDSMVNKLAAEAGIVINNKELSDIKTALRTGKDYPESMNKSLWDQLFTSQGFVQFATIFLDNFNPLAGILGTNLP